MLVRLSMRRQCRAICVKRAIYFSRSRRERPRRNFGREESDSVRSREPAAPGRAGACCRAERRRRQSHYSYKRKIRDAADSSPRSPARCVLLYIPTLICKATKTCTTFCLLFPLPNNSRYSPLSVSGHPHASYNTPSKRSFSRWSLTALCTVISDRKSH